MSSTTDSLGPSMRNTFQEGCFLEAFQYIKVSKKHPFVIPAGSVGIVLVSDLDHRSAPDDQFKSSELPGDCFSMFFCFFPPSLVL